MVVKINKICGGEPVIEGTRISVAVILGHLRDGSNIEEIVKTFHWITEDDIRDCLQYAICLCSK